MSELQSAVSGSLASIECLHQVVGSDWLGKTAVAAIFLVVGGIFVKAVTAIFNEYVKRFWIKWVHPDEIAAAKKELQKLQAKIEIERQEVEAFVAETTGLVQAVDRLFAEVVSLRVQNNKLKTEKAELQARLQGINAARRGRGKPTDDSNSARLS